MIHNFAYVRMILLIGCMLGMALNIIFQSYNLQLQIHRLYGLCLHVFLLIELRTGRAYPIYLIMKISLFFQLVRIDKDLVQRIESSSKHKEMLCKHFKCESESATFHFPSHHPSTLNYITKDQKKVELVQELSCIGQFFFLIFYIFNSKIWVLLGWGRKSNPSPVKR